MLDRKDKSRYATFTRRTLVMGGGVTVVLGALGARLCQLQILEGEEFMTRADENRVSQRLLAPSRGRIFDRFAVELASNRRNYRVDLIPEHATNGVESVLDEIGRIMVITPRERARILNDAATNRRFMPTMVAENLTWDEFARLNLHLPYLAGVQPDVGETRDYPFGSQVSHILGYVAAVSPDDKDSDDDPLLDLPEFRVGKRGIEKEFESQVRGTAGASRVEVNAYGRVIRELRRDPGKPGSDVYLTIDNDVQKFAVQRLGGESSACVVMDVTNGDVIAMASTPGYDPNVFNTGISDAEWKALTTDDHKPLIDKAIGGEYPPGSTFKPGMALAAMDNGLEDLQVNCTGSMTLGSNVFHCYAWKSGGHGHVDLKRGISVSCDIFFYEVARRLGIDKMYDAALKVGLGARTGIELPGEHSGFMPSRDWKLAHYGVPWQEGETLNTGIGQGYVTATPLQLCTVAARIASGNAVSPRITRVIGRRAQPRPQLDRLAVSDRALAAVQDGMNMVTNAAGGSAYAWRITEPGFEMAGKTGTAQVRRITKEDRVTGRTGNSELPWNLREHALFMAYAPVGKPRYALSIIQEHGATLSHPHVQMARDILLFTQQRDPVNRPAAYPIDAAAHSGAASGGHA